MDRSTRGRFVACWALPSGRLVPHFPPLCATSGHHSAVPRPVNGEIAQRLWGWALARRPLSRRAVRRVPPPAARRASQATVLALQECEIAALGTHLRPNALPESNLGSAPRLPSPAPRLPSTAPHLPYLAPRLPSPAPRLIGPAPAAVPGATHGGTTTRIVAVRPLRRPESRNRPAKSAFWGT